MNKGGYPVFFFLDTQKRKGALVAREEIRDVWVSIKG
jgi:hypothetical protein